MNEIKLLDKDTIDKIAAGEVIERPASVVKELLENAVDSGASSISVEIKNGGIELIRVTDNGSGIPKDQIRRAVLRHSTSKIENAKDLSNIKTLGFRGEALSSICAVSRTEILTKTEDSLTGVIYKAEGGSEVSFEDAGLPSGTTVIVRNIFYNVPARLKFLKSPRAEAAYISDIVEKLALSHSEISFKFINNSDVRLATAGRGSLKEAVYSVFGRDISSNILEVDSEDDLLKIKGFIGRPEIARSTRALENVFINGRYVKDKVVSKAAEDAYKGYQMKGTFPFFCLNIYIAPDLIDVNVHPSKQEIKFSDAQAVYESIYRIISRAVKSRENIPEFSLNPRKNISSRNNTARPTLSADKPADKNENSKGIVFADNQEAASENEKINGAVQHFHPAPNIPEPFEQARRESLLSDFEKAYGSSKDEEKYEQETIFSNKFISAQAMPEIRIVGQVFDTYWICEYENKMYIIDQHAAHEKVLYEKFMKQIGEGEVPVQMVSPAIIITLTAYEENTLVKYMDYFKKAGFIAEHFGGSEWAITGVPAGLFSSIDSRALFSDMLSELSEYGSSSKPEILLDRVATAACKAAVKGNNALSYKEAQELITSLLSLENPYNCPHGRPTIITMSKYEMERKFKRII